MQVCGYIHAISHQCVAALGSYIKAKQEPVYAFSFIYNMLSLLDNEERDAFESAVISRIPDLVKLSRLCFYSTFCNIIFRILLLYINIYFLY